MSTENFPLQIISQTHLNKHTSCPVCLEDFVEGITEVRALPCEHFFHDECLKSWLNQSKTCPLCRHQLPISDRSSVVLRWNDILPGSRGLSRIQRQNRRRRSRSRRRSASRSQSRNRSGSQRRRI